MVGVDVDVRVDCSGDKESRSIVEQIDLDNRPQ